MKRLCASLLLTLSFPSFLLAQTTRTQNAIACRVSVESSAWTSDLAPLTISIRNDSDSDLDLTATPELFLRNYAWGEYWAPTDITHSSAIPTIQGSDSVTPVPIHLHIPKRDSLDFRVDAARTKWAKTISSLWPNQSLSTVPNGDYFVRLEIESDEAQTLKSNEVKVVLSTGETR